MKQKSVGHLGQVLGFSVRIATKTTSHPKQRPVRPGNGADKAAAAKKLQLTPNFAFKQSEISFSFGRSVCQHASVPLPNASNYFQSNHPQSRKVRVFIWRFSWMNKKQLANAANNYLWLLQPLSCQFILNHSAVLLLAVDFSAREHSHTLVHRVAVVAVDASSE